MNLQKALAAIDWTVVDELRHIPGGASGSAQEQLRHEYAAFRTLHRDLSPQLRPHDALVQAVGYVRRRWPQFVPSYDAAFFVNGSTVSITLADDELTLDIEAMAANGGQRGGERKVADAEGAELDRVRA